MPVFNRRELTLQCLRSLSRVDRTGITIHVIVVDDASTDGTAEAIIQQFPDVEIVPTKGNLWYTAGTNRGITAALKHEPDYILCCNDDSIFEEKCVRNMVECAEKYTRSVVGAVLLDWAMPHKVRQVAPQWRLAAGGLRHWRKQTVWTIPNKPWEVEIIVGNCVLYPAAAIRESGLMDEKRLVQYGDAEYTPRMRRKKWRLLIEPKARVFCEPNVAPARFRHMSFGKKIKELFSHSGQQHSLRRRIHMTLGSAPNLLQGIAAVPVFFARAALGKTYEGSWADRLVEKPLSETFADTVVKD
ncbi:MAG: glycosyltransferase family 2 protein [Saprospiraceae bacterium]|nr:glycosyltransferase family 2 protein [Pyrinomonadaceae bacterium]